MSINGAPYDLLATEPDQLAKQENKIAEDPDQEMDKNAAHVCF